MDHEHFPVSLRMTMQQGRRIVRYGGRYFVSAIKVGGFDIGYVKMIIREIPSQLEQYKVWFRRERERYQKMTRLLENDILVLTDNRGHRARRTYLRDVTPWKLLDEDLCEMPSPFCYTWVSSEYKNLCVVDLDRELCIIRSEFTPNTLCFRLSDVSSSTWIRSNLFREHIDGMSGLDVQIPDDSIRVEPQTYFARSPDDCGMYAVRYQGYHRSPLTLHDTLNVSSRTYPQQMFSLAIFKEMIRTYRWVFKDSISKHAHTDFAFRETAYAMLCLLNGRFRHDEACLFGSKFGWGKGYRSDTTVAKRPRDVPTFGFMCHAPEQDPGSAPLDDVYWFDGVLVVLVPDSAFSRNTGPIIAKAIEFVRLQNCLQFRAILFSIQRALLLEAAVRDGVTSVKESIVLSIVNPLLRSRDLRAMQNFMASRPRPRRISSAVSGVFPAELYEMIITHADYTTQFTCSQVCREFREFSFEPFEFSSNLFMINLIHTPKSPLHRALGDKEIFVFQDRTSGHIMEYYMGFGYGYKYPYHDYEELPSTDWHPVIGSDARSCMLDVILVVLRLKATHDLVKTKGLT